jgi:hypothetical protein
MDQGSGSKLVDLQNHAYIFVSLKRKNAVLVTFTTCDRIEVDCITH